MQKIYIFDTTLRDGEQVPGAKLNTVEKIAIARQLEKLGVDIIEAGFPVSSPEDFNSVKEISKIIKNSVVCGLSRGVEKDITVAYEAVKSARKPRIHTFVPTSEMQLKYIIHKSQAEVLAMIEMAVKKAKSYVPDVEFSPMDASRTSLDFLIKTIKTAIACGATTINVPDTVGYALPEEWTKMIKAIVQAVPEFRKEIILSVHTHDDLGFATANALAGIVNGARQVEGTINGIGERAGNCALEEVVMALKTRSDKEYRVDINTREIFRTSRTVSQVMGIPVQPNKAIVGANAFAHSSGIHQDGIIKHRENFEIINPEDVGLSKSEIILTARSGRAALLHKLNQLNYKVGKEDIDKYYERFLQIADQKKEVYDNDLHLLVAEVKGNNGFANKSAKERAAKEYRLELVQVLCGNKNIPMAEVQIKSGKQIREASGVGTGPVDASFKAVDAALGMSGKITLKEFLVQAITEGIDAQGKVTVQIAHKGKNAIGYGADGDIIVASTKAYLDAINKI